MPTSPLRAGLYRASLGLSPVILSIYGAKKEYQNSSEMGLSADTLHPILGCTSPLHTSMKPQSTISWMGGDAIAPVASSGSVWFDYPVLYLSEDPECSSRRNAFLAAREIVHIKHNHHVLNSLIWRCCINSCG